MTTRAPIQWFRPAIHVWAPGPALLLMLTRCALHVHIAERGADLIHPCVELVLRLQLPEVPAPRFLEDIADVEKPVLRGLESAGE